MSKITPINISDYRQIVVMTGAGISAASGLPTYRGAGGLWNEIDVENNATAAAVQSDPKRVWRFFAELRKKVAGARPNAAGLVPVAGAPALLVLDQDDAFVRVTYVRVEGVWSRLR